MANLSDIELYKCLDNHLEHVEQYFKIYSRPFSFAECLETVQKNIVSAYPKALSMRYWCKLGPPDDLFEHLFEGLAPIFKTWIKGAPLAAKPLEAITPISFKDLPTGSPGILAISIHHFLSTSDKRIMKTPNSASPVETITYIYGSAKADCSDNYLLEALRRVDAEYKTWEPLKTSSEKAKAKCLELEAARVTIIDALDGK